MNKKSKFLMIICGILTVLGASASIYTLLHKLDIFPEIIVIYIYVLVVYYALYGYRVPHGNLLKWLMLLYSLSFVFGLTMAAEYGVSSNTVIIPIIMMLVSYMAGRLDKINQNKYISVVVLVLLFHVAIKTIFADGNYSFGVILSKLSSVIIWADTCGAYFVRYKEHKEAGLQD